MPDEPQSKRVLVVEDDDDMREMLGEILRGGGYDCQTVESGLRALSYLAEAREPDLVFSDVDMPGIDGIEFLRTVKTIMPAVPVVIVSGNFGSELGVDAVLGGAADYLYKPVRSAAVLEMASRYLGPGGRIPESVFQESLAALISQNGNAPLQTPQILGLFETLGMKRYETLQHSRRVSDYSVMLGYRHGISKAELEDLRIGALLHDIGKIAVPHNVLMKPGPLDDTEWEVMRTHPRIGWDLLSNFPQLGPAADIVHTHHERWDGGGYPRRIEGLKIPIGARIFSVIDTLDAMLSERPYRAGLPLSTAREEIDAMSGTQFDPDIVKTFTDISDLELMEIRRRYPDRETFGH